MNYIGSKLSLLPFLEQSIDAVVGKDCKVFCDLFAGTGIVGRHFKQKGFSIIANDLQHYSYVLNRHYIGNNDDLQFTSLTQTISGLKQSDVAKRKHLVCEHLSNITPLEGFIYQNYCTGGTQNQTHQRLYFTDENGLLCDAIRKKIEDWHSELLINDDEYFFLLASLIESIDKLANTASVYGAFLKKFKRSATQKLILKPAEIIPSQRQHKVYCGNSNEIIGQIETDILYLDPPYNHRQYAPNYHLLETISRYDNPIIKGKTGLRDYGNQKSDWSIKKNVKEAFIHLLEQTKTKYVFLSYNNEGLLSLNEIEEVMGRYGQYGVFTQSYNRFKADKTENRNHLANSTTEYLHYVVMK